jgi:hypothetical protein
MSVLPPVAVLVQIPAELRTRLRVAAARQDRTMSAVIIEALESLLDGRDAARDHD